MLEIFGDTISPEQRAKLQRQCRFLTPDEAEELETLLLAAMEKQDKLIQQQQSIEIRRDSFLIFAKGACAAAILGCVAGFVTLLIRPGEHKVAFDYGSSAAVAGYVLYRIKKDDLDKVLKD